MNRAFVFIDGSNFFHRVRDLLAQLPGKYHFLDFDYIQFGQWLVRPNNLHQVRYYVAALRRRDGDKKSEQLYASQQRFISRLQRQRVMLTFGQIIQHPDKSFHEKGVDVRIAVEMIRFGREGLYDTAYLVSSDTDLVPAVEEVRRLGKNVHYVGFAKGQSFGLTRAANDVTLIRPDDILSFMPKAVV